MNLNILFDIYGAQISPNDQLKYSILTDHNQSVYNISHLDFAIMCHTINASDVQIHVQPAILDETKIRLDIQSMPLPLTLRVNG
jgi:hypothetical protein